MSAGWRVSLVARRRRRRRRADVARGLGKGGERALTVNVLRAVEVDAQDAAVGEGQDDEVIGHLRGDKFGGDGELELDSLDGEDGQPVVERRAGG